MRYNTKALKRCNRKDSEYSLTESHNHVEKTEIKEDCMVQCTENKVEFKTEHRNKKVKVTLEFPKQSNPSIEQEFEAGLKELYLKKVKVLSIQERESALSSITTRDKEENYHE